MKNAHALSRQYVVDPSYSRDRRRPGANGLSLYSRKAHGPCWLYNPGDLEAFLLARLRHEAFLACYHVGHPGRFRSFSPILYAKRTFPLVKVPKSGKVTLCFSGNINLCVNGKLVLHIEGSHAPVRRTFDVRRHLKPGDNSIRVRLHRMDEPPALAMFGPFLSSDERWEVSRDAVVWSAASCVPFEGAQKFPHQERLPEIRLRPQSKIGDVYDFGVELLGRPGANVRPGTDAVLFFAGESRAEVLDARAEGREQLILPVREKPGKVTSKLEMALRFLRVQAPAGHTVQDVAFNASLFPVQYRGAFACSDERLNRIWMHAAYTLRLCMRELFIDGLKRDRMGWVGDLYLSMLGNAYTFAERDVERRSLTALYSADPVACEFNGIIDYTLFWVISLWTHLLHHDDPAYLRQIREQLYSLMHILENKEDANGFLPSSRFSWIFIDWAPVAKAGYSACLQMVYIMALEAAHNIARADGEEARAGLFGRKAERLRRQCREWFWDKQRRLFADNWADGKRGKTISRHANFLAFLSGVVGSKEYGPMLDRIFQATDIQPVGTPYMMALESSALCRAGRPERMLGVLRDYWGGMLDRGACTFWEAYDPKAGGAEQYAFYDRPYGKSLCHAWSAGPAFLLPGELLGIRPLAPGWQRFSVAPQIGDLDWACATVPTPHGDIKVEVNGSRVAVRVPKGTVLERRTQKGMTQRHPGPCKKSFTIRATQAFTA